jgi:hypothetical protein
MFCNSTGFQIYGGSFYDVQSGDVNLHTHQHLTIQDQTLNHVSFPAAPPNSATLALEDGWEADVSEVARNRRRNTASHGT